jgi:hypothetical protein
MNRLPVLKIFQVFLVITFFFWWGESFGPRNASAEIYKVLAKGHQQQAKPDYSIEKEINFNGLSQKTVLSYEKGSPSEVMKLIRERSKLKHRVSVDRVITALTRPYQFSGENWGVFVQFFRNVPDNLSSKVVDQIHAKKPIHSDVKMGYSVFVTQVADGYSAIWRTEFDHNLDMSAWITSPGKDMPGKDISNISRFPGSTRAWSLVDDNKQYLTHSVAYLGKGNIESHQRYYQSLLSNNGYKLRDTSKTSEGISLIFYKPSQELTVFISENLKNNPKQDYLPVVDIVQLSTSKHVETSSIQRFVP